MTVPPDIRITDVIAHPLTQQMPHPTTTSWGTYDRVSIVLVEVRTDAGITGVGETLARFAPRAYAHLIEDALKPRLVGQPAHAISAHWRAMRRALSGRAGGVLVEAIAGVDIALWDILGKAANLPIATVLGGEGRAQVDVYAASVNWLDDAGAEAELDRLIEQGFPRIKVKLARPVPDACRRIERLRARAGDGVELYVDANWAYSLDEAVEVGRALAANRYAWFEEPLRPEDEQGYEDLRRRCDVPLAAGESNYTVHQARRLVENRTLSVLQPDVARSGGITETRRMAELAAVHDVAYAPHIGMSGIVCETASVHLAAAMPNFRVMECEGDRSPFKTDLADLAPGCLRQKNGRLDVPTGPGLGEHVQKWQFKPETTPFTAIGDGSRTVSHYHLAPDGWQDLPGGGQRLCYNEIPTKVNWTYLRFDFDLASMRPLGFRCNDREFDVSAFRSIRIPAMKNLWCMLNFAFFVETDVAKRAFLYLDSVCISADC